MYMCMHVLLTYSTCMVLSIQLDAARQGNTQDSRELHEKVAAAQTKIDVSSLDYTFQHLHVIPLYLPLFLPGFGERYKGYWSVSC